MSVEFWCGSSCGVGRVVVAVELWGVEVKIDCSMYLFVHTLLKKIGPGKLLLDSDDTLVGDGEHLTSYSGQLVFYLRVIRFLIKNGRHGKYK